VDRAKSRGGFLIAQAIIQKEEKMYRGRWDRAGLAAVLAAMLLLTLAGISNGGDTLTVHYKRYAGDYDDWTLWTWDDKTDTGSQELTAVSKDDQGLVFHVVKSEYGDGTQIGLLPKFRDWESKDPPDRIWTAGMGDEVWILQGNPDLFTEQPGEDVMGKDVGPVITVHYHRPAGDYSGWTLWTWDDLTDKDSREITSSGMDDYGMVFKVERKNYGEDGTQIGLLPKFGNWASKDAPDRIWMPYMGNEVWILAGNEELFTEVPDTTPWIIGALIEGERSVTISLSAPLPQDKLKPAAFSIKDTMGNVVEVTQVRQIPPHKGGGFAVGLTLERDLDIRAEPVSEYTVTVEGYRPTHLIIRGILDSPEFVSDEELGAIYSPAQTVFRVFAPSAGAVKVVLYDEPADGDGSEHDMQYTQGGVWELTLTGDLLGKYYNLKASGSDPRFLPEHLVIDPYSRCNTAHDGRAMIIQDDTPVAPGPVFDKSEAVIYELHVRDFTIDPKSGIEHRGKYLGFTETGTTLEGSPDIKTGIDHLQELGVNVVHVMPIQDFYNDESKDDYNWGYMPVHFDSPDGWYATETYNAKRVEEFKRMVDAIHKKGIKVVMDVVYNHTAEYRPERVFSFEGLVPGYYYRLKDDGTYWNGSGTGNETRSEAPMMRKFMLESTKYWVEKYGVDGFRFDLMGLTDLETIVRIVEELKAIKPDIIIYGEPWTGGETPINPTVKGMQRGKGFSVFGDHFRDAIKGGVFDINKGFVQAGVDIDRIKKGIMGSINDFTQDPPEAINYVASHDNRTFWDRLVVTTRGDRNVTDQDRRRMDKLGAVLVLTSQGIPFLQSGQEMLRTKRGSDNSYNQPDAINMINWQWKKDNLDIFEYYRGLIALRKAHPIFRMTTREAVIENLEFLDDDLGIPVPARCVAYKLMAGDSGDAWDEVLLLFNPNPNAVTFTIPKGTWTVVVNGDEAGTAPVEAGGGRISGDKAEVAGISAMVLYR
jgi:pullulanase